MDDASWAISAFLPVAFFIAGAASGGALSIGWFLLALGMTVVAVVRFRARSDR